MEEIFVSRKYNTRKNFLLIMKVKIFTSKFAYFKDFFKIDIFLCAGSLWNKSLRDL